MADGTRVGWGIPFLHSRFTHGYFIWDRKYLRVWLISQND